MPEEPKERRAVSFLDGQNLFRHANDAFRYYQPNYDPVGSQWPSSPQSDGSLPVCASRRAFRMPRRRRCGTANPAADGRGVRQHVRERADTPAQHICQRKAGGGRNYRGILSGSNRRQAQGPAQAEALQSRRHHLGRVVDIVVWQLLPANAGKPSHRGGQSRQALGACSSCRLPRAEFRERARTGPRYAAQSPIDTCRRPALQYLTLHSLLER